MLNCVSSKKFVIQGEKMSDFIWYWTKGNSRFFTRNTQIAEKAMKDGILVMGRKVKPNILKF
jgi:hypothetical protein